MTGITETEYGSFGASALLSVFCFDFNKDDLWRVEVNVVIIVVRSIST